MDKLCGVYALIAKIGAATGENEPKGRDPRRGLIARRSLEAGIRQDWRLVVEGHRANADAVCKRRNRFTILFKRPNDTSNLGVWKNQHWASCENRSRSVDEIEATSNKSITSFMFLTDTATQSEASISANMEI